MRVTHRSIAIAMFLVSMTLIGCSRRPDPSAQAEQALKEANLTQVKVDWDGDAHVAHLKGTVSTPADRDRAQDVTTAAIGTSGKVLNEVTITGINDQTAGDLDRDIRRAVKKAIDRDPVLKDRDIDVDVNNGAVLVKGDVRSAAEKSKVTELVRNAPGVRELANALEIKADK